MNTTAYLILWINGTGIIYDAQMASSFPVAQMVNQGTQVKLCEAIGNSYGEAQLELLAILRRAQPWVFNLPTMKKRMLG